MTLTSEMLAEEVKKKIYHNNETTKDLQTLFVQRQASVKVTPDSTQFVLYDRASFSCEDLGPGDWSVWRFGKSGDLSECGSGWGTNSTTSVCELKTLQTFDSGLYWCESKYLGSSDTINITVTGFSVILETPVHVQEGQDVVLSCRFKPGSQDLNVVFYRDELLLKSGPDPQATVRFSEDHQGAYTCEHDGQRSPPVHMYLQEDSSAPVLVLNPDSEQFLEYKSVNLSCQPPTEGWTVRRRSAHRSTYRPAPWPAHTQTKTGSQCGSDWGTERPGWVCELNTLKRRDSATYWCGKNTRRSNSVQLEVKYSGVVLQVPVRPVSVGQTVSLICENQLDVSFSARFYRDGHFLSEQPAGNMTLQQVVLSDEGQYECEMGGERSQPSRLRVRAGASPPETLRSVLALLHLRYILVFAPYVASSLLCISICRQTGESSVVLWRPRRGRRRREFNLEPQYEDVIPDVTTEYQF
ncbi:Fc receptor-like protein 4 [Eucyclogobius newberryi]|uniref:Fc receptor-like protein 4 n=1 Tax=Eucyclogobius newberryi TaxID=166745 RepID=UPI003B5A1CCD